MALGIASTDSTQHVFLHRMFRRLFFSQRACTHIVLPHLQRWQEVCRRASTERDVRRLHVSVDDALLVGGVEGFGSVFEELYFCERSRPTLALSGVLPSTSSIAMYGLLSTEPTS